MLTDQEYRQAVADGRVSLPPRPKPDPGCAYCHGRGVIADPDGGLAEPCPLRRQPRTGRSLERPVVPRPVGVAQGGGAMSHWIDLFLIIGGTMAFAIAFMAMTD
jgi:hypothetical protein